MIKIKKIDKKLKNKLENMFVSVLKYSLIVVIFSLIFVIGSIYVFEDLNIEICNETIKMDNTGIINNLVFYNLDDCYEDYNFITLSYYNKHAGFHEDGFFCRVKDCNEDGYCRDVDIKLRVK